MSPFARILRLARGSRPQRVLTISVPRPKGSAEQKSLVEAEELNIYALSVYQNQNVKLHCIDKVALRIARNRASRAIQ